MINFPYPAFLKFHCLLIPHYMRLLNKCYICIFGFQICQNLRPLSVVATSVYVTRYIDIPVSHNSQAGIVLWLWLQFICHGCYFNKTNTTSVKALLFSICSLHRSSKKDNLQPSHSIPCLALATCSTLSWANIRRKSIINPSILSILPSWYYSSCFCFHMSTVFLVSFLHVLLHPCIHILHVRYPFFCLSKSFLNVSHRVF